MSNTEPTSFGGVRRTRSAQTIGTSEKASEKAKSPMRYGHVETGRDTGYYSEGHSHNMGEAGGSNPSPRTFIFTWHERLGLEECPYLIRWKIETPAGSIRLHHWLGPDDDRAHHDHPWAFRTFVIKGGYTDWSPEGSQHLKAPATQKREAIHRHTVVPDLGGAWTVIVTGPKIRSWGFWADGVKFVKANKWFLSRGHHPCS
jgi:hypothetical protein